MRHRFSPILRYEEPTEAPSAEPLDLEWLLATIQRTIAWAESLVGEAEGQVR